MFFRQKELKALVVLNAFESTTNREIVKGFTVLKGYKTEFFGLITSKLSFSFSDDKAVYMFYCTPKETVTKCHCAPNSATEENPFLLLLVRGFSGSHYYWILFPP